MSTSTPTPSTTSSTGTPTAPGSSSGQPSAQQSMETSIMASIIYPHMQNAGSDQNNAASAVQIALLIQDEAVKQEKQKQKDDEAKAKADEQAKTDAAGGLKALAQDPVVQAGLAPGATPQQMKDALNRIAQAAKAAEEASQQQGGQGQGSPTPTPVPVTASNPKK